jgi:glycosyltransferase involved in cell wall biosynthesis
MSKRRLLLVCPSHPAMQPGGMELYVLGLHEALRRAGRFDPILLTRADPRQSPARATDLALAPIEGEPSQFVLHTRPDDYDAFHGRSRRPELLERDYREFLLEQRPDVIHFHHAFHLGYEIVEVTRRVLPDAPIVFSFHEFLPICHRHGQMVRTIGDELCQEETPQRCNECFPGISPDMFVARKHWVQSSLSHVDLFIAPSEYVFERYADWGVPRARMQIEPQGYDFARAIPAAPESDGERARDRFGYFGQLNPYKGVHVLLRAMELLGDEFAGRLWIHGANLDRQPAAARERLEPLLARPHGKVTLAGAYDRADLGKLMTDVDWVVVPSLVWETGPRVVLEAFEYGRPVICSDIGGMAEKVSDGVNGLHFRRGDPADLARVLGEAAASSELWSRLRSGIPVEPLHSMAAHIAVLEDVYERLLAAGVGSAGSGRR